MSSYGPTFKAFVREAFDAEYAAVRATPPTVRKALLLDLIRKAGKFDESKHPRDDRGRYVSRDKIQAAASDPAKRKELEASVTDPEQRKKLHAAISDQDGTTGRTKRGQAAHEAAGRRTTREEGKAKTAALLSHLKRVGDLKAKLTADHLHDLADHLQSGHPTVEDVRAMRKALAGAGQGLASFGGARKKDAMVAALVAHAKGKAFDARVKEQGFDQEEMRDALAPAPEAAAATVEPPAVEPTLQELETGVRPGGGRRAQHTDPMSRPYRREEEAEPNPAAAQGFAQSPPIPANSPPITALSGADAGDPPSPNTKRDEGYHKWLQANGYGPQTLGVQHPRDSDYHASQVQGGWATPYTNGVYKDKRQAMAEARRALNDFAPRKPAAAKPESPRAAEARQEATADARAQQASGRIAKQNHERTLAEFTAREGAMWGGPEKAAAVHRRIVEGSLAKGETVPPEVLADYPDLAPRPARPAGADDARPTADEGAGASAPAGKQSDRPKVEYVRASPGGQTSEVDGKFYRGGQLMPVHGRYSGQGKPPKGSGIGTGDPVQAKEDSAGGGVGGRGPQLSPEERREKAEAQRKWDEMNAGPLGKLTWLGTSPNSKAFDPKTQGVRLDKWREFAEQIGPDGVKRIVAALEPEFHGAVGSAFGAIRDEHARKKQAGEWNPAYHRDIEPGAEEWEKNQAKVRAGEAEAMMRGGKGHEKKVPGSHYARELVQEMMRQDNNSGRPMVDVYHRLNGILAGSSQAPATASPASPPPATAKPARAAKPKAAARPAWVAADPAASAALDAHAAAPGRAKEVIGNALANAGLYGTDRDGNPTGPAAEPPESDSGRTPAQELAGALAAGHRDQHDLGHSDEEREATASLLRELGAVQVGEVGGSARFDGAVHDGPPGAFTGHAVTVTRPGWKVPLGGGRWWVPVKARTGRPGV